MHLVVGVCLISLIHIETIPDVITGWVMKTNVFAEKIYLKV